VSDLVSSLLGVPATILIAAGLGLAGVTVVSRARRRRDPPIRWVHLALGIALLACGGLVLLLDLAVVGVVR
jgi:drug/metabolite transporter (DMT)-like permease